MTDRDFEGAESVSMSLREPAPPWGLSDITIDSMRKHQGLGGNGVMIRAIMDDGAVRAWRIQLGGKFPQYGIRDTKAVIGAIKGWGFDDPRTAAINADEIARYLGDTQPGKGARIRIDCLKGKIDPKTGNPWPNVRVMPLAGASPAAAPAPTEEWFDFPANDPRYKLEQYARDGRTRKVA